MVTLEAETLSALRDALQPRIGANTVGFVSQRNFIGSFAHIRLVRTRCPQPVSTLPARLKDSSGGGPVGGCLGPGNLRDPPPGRCPRTRPCPAPRVSD